VKTNIAVMAYYDLGLSIIAIAPDGSKGPAKEVGSWKPHQNNQAPLEVVNEWYVDDSNNGVAIVCGAVSKNLTVLDFETDAAYQLFARDCADEGLMYILDLLPIASTPSGGRHVYCFGINSKNMKLAKTEEGKTLIETKGEGGYVLAPGCPAECHQTGKLYQWVQNSLAECRWQPVEIAQDSFDSMVNYCRHQNAGAKAEFSIPVVSQFAGVRQDVKRPGDDFNERASWEEILLGQGWVIARRRENKIFWRRPGKDGEGISASTGHCSTDASGDLLYVFSTNAEPFEAERCYSKFSAYTIYNHSGDYYKASKALNLQGFGDPEVFAKLTNIGAGNITLIKKVAAVKVANENHAKTFPVKEEGRTFEWAEEIQVDETNTNWYWKGYVQAGNKTLLSALWKSGKTTLLAKLLHGFCEGGTFLGQPIEKTRVLYASEEGKTNWTPRIKRYGYTLKTHGFFLRPFHGERTMTQWIEFLGRCNDEMEKFGLNILVIDTLANLWPVVDENNAGMVMQGLVPMNQILESGKKNKAIIAVHHTRKSGGENFTASRGSGAISSDFDYLLEFKRPEGGGYGVKSKTTRQITASGRAYQETPEDILFDYIDDEYLLLGEPSEVRLDERRKSVIEALDQHDWKFADTIRAESGHRNTYVNAELTRLVDLNLIEVTGTGKRGDKKRYKLKTIVQATQTSFVNGEDHVHESF